MSPRTSALHTMSTHFVRNTPSRSTHPICLSELVSVTLSPPISSLVCPAHLTSLIWPTSASMDDTSAYHIRRVCLLHRPTRPPALDIRRFVWPLTALDSPAATTISACLACLSRSSSSASPILCLLSAASTRPSVLSARCARLVYLTRFVHLVCLPVSLSCPTTLPASV